MKLVKKPGIFDVLIVLVILGALWIRVTNFEYPLSNHETSRDYLVSHHILKYQELPILGPHNGGLNLPVNSPVYFYLLSFFLIFYDDLLTLEVFNIFLQLLAIAAIYFLGKTLFGPKTGLVAAIFFASSYQILAESYSLWQPFVMMPFLYLAYLWLALGFVRNSFRLLSLGGLVMVFAGALHISALAILPVYWFFQYLLFKKQRRSLLTIVNVYLAQIIFLIALYAPVIYFNLTNQTYNLAFTNSGDTLLSKFVFNPLIILENFSNILATLFEFFFVRQELLPYFALISGLVILFFILKGDRREKTILAVLVAIIGWVGLLVAFLVVPVRGYYLIPVFGIFTIVLAKLLVQFSQKNIATFVFLVIAVVFLTTIFSWDFSFKRSLITSNAREQLDSIISAMSDEINNVKVTDGRDDLRFFQIYIDEKNNLNPVEALFWVPLEEYYAVKFTKVMEPGNSYGVLNSNDYMFLVCKLYVDKNEEKAQCLDKYLTATGNIYSQLANIYDRYPFSIYFLKKS